MKYQSIPSVRERFHVRVDDGRARFLMQPRLRETDAAFHSKALDDNAWNFRRDCQVGEERHPLAAPQRPIKIKQGSLTCNDAMPAPFPQRDKCRIKERVLKF